MSLGVLRYEIKALLLLLFVLTRRRHTIGRSNMFMHDGKNWKRKERRLADRKHMCTERSENNRVVPPFDVRSGERRRSRGRIGGQRIGASTYKVTNIQDYSMPCNIITQVHRRQG